MSEITKVLDIATAELGYIEKSKAAYRQDPTVLYDKTKGAGSDNYTKYAKEMDDLHVYNGIKQGYAWCNVFVDWCFMQSLGKDRAQQLLIGWSAGCTQDWNWLKAKGLIVTSPQKGDLIFFKNLAHIGIVEKVENGKVYTIEGNTSNKAELIVNGGEVARKEYALNSSAIYGYARPKYDVSSPIDVPTEPTEELPLLLKGSTGKYVREAQQKLLAKGYRLPKFGADGYFRK